MTFYHLVAVTLDGKIARTSDHLSTEWTSEEDKRTFRAFLKTCDTFVVGRKTYKTAERPLSKRNCIVFTRSVDGAERVHENLLHLNASSGDALRAELEKMGSKRVAVLGGTSVYDWCFANGFADELHLTVEPLVFGEGLPFLSSGALEDSFELISHEKLNERGTMLLKYKASS